MASSTSWLLQGELVAKGRGKIQFFAGEETLDRLDCEVPLDEDLSRAGSLSLSLLTGIERVVFRDFDAQDAIVLTLQEGGWRCVQHLCDAFGLLYSGLEAHRDLGHDPRGMLVSAYACEYPHVELTVGLNNSAAELVDSLVALTGVGTVTFDIRESLKLVPAL